MTENEYYFSEKCIVSIPSAVSVYVDSIDAHVKAALYDEAVMLCDTVLGKCSSSELKLNAVAASTLLLSQQSNDVSLPSLESTGITRKRNRSATSTDGDTVTQLLTNKHAVAQIALYKTEALLELGKADDALLCVDRSVSSCCYSATDHC